MKGRNTYGIVILKSLYCLNVYERQKYIWYCNIKEFVLFKYERYIWYCNMSLYCLNVYEKVEIHMVL